MPRRQVVELTCSRCERIEQVPIADAGEKTADFVFHGKFITDAGPVEVKFEDLCSPCRRTVKSLFDTIGKKIEGMAPDRKEGSRRAKQAPVREPAAKEPAVEAKKEETHHNGSPPLPHPAQPSAKPHSPRA